VSHTKKLTKSAGFLSWRGKEPRIGRSPFLRNKKGCGDDGDQQAPACKKKQGLALHKEARRRTCGSSGDGEG
jgi:hypothetical protein